MHFSDPDFGAFLGGEFEDAFDCNGNNILTRCCNVYMMWNSITERYVCPKCKRTITRKQFLDIYVEPYGPECYSCRTNFPRCVICHKNHQYECDQYEFY